jgi:predicted RNA-binding protein YlxR (DUF448 family)
MVRVVRTPEGSVVIDPSGKRAGRGAYICAAPECWQRALRGGSLARALKSEISASDLSELRAWAENLSSEQSLSGAPAAR